MSGTRTLYVSLVLTDESAERDAAIVEALRVAPGLDWFDRILLKLPSWQECPHATRHPLVQHVLTICRMRGIDVILGRNLWVLWPDTLVDPSLAPSAYAHFDPAHYIAAISHVNAEAAALGVAGSCLDGELYGKSAQEPLQGIALTAWDRARMNVAIAHATRVAGRVDGIRPASSGSQHTYPWTLVGLGDERFDSIMYKNGPPDWTSRKAIPPQGTEWLVHHWGIWVGKDAQSIEDVLAWDIDVIRQAHPECNGLWVYIGAKEFADTLRNWPAGD